MGKTTTLFPHQQTQATKILVNKELVKIDMPKKTYYRYYFFIYISLINRIKILSINLIDYYNKTYSEVNDIK